MRQKSKSRRTKKPHRKVAIRKVSNRRRKNTLRRKRVKKIIKRKQRGNKKHQLVFGRLVLKKKLKCGNPCSKITNPFLNFLKVFRMKRSDWPPYYAAREGAKLWCRLSNKDRMRFHKETWGAAKKKTEQKRKKTLKKTIVKKKVR